MSKKLRVFEAFAGYGSQSIALRNIGVNYEVVAISEIDKYAIQAYEAIHGKVNNLGDISKINVDDIPEHDLFTYSFPCQDISLAGNQLGLNEGSLTRSSLLWECKKVICASKPKYLLMENVDNLIGKKHIDNFNKWLQWLKDNGYSSFYKIIDSSDCNIPQQRRRVFLVSILGDCEYEFPQPKPLLTSIKDLLEDNVESKYFLSDKAISKMKRFEPKLIKRYDVIPTLTTELSHHTGKNFCPKWVKIIGEYRRPTERECFRFMGMSDSDIDKILSANISSTQLYKLAGNSIVVQVLEEIFKNLLQEYI